MNRSTRTRLVELERVHNGLMRAKEHSTEGAARDAIEWAQNVLRTLGVEQQKTESLAEALARALHVRTTELMGRLQQAAAGGSFWTADELRTLEGSAHAEST